LRDFEGFFWRFLQGFPMIFDESGRKKNQNFFAGFSLYLLQVMLRDNDLRGAFLVKIG
jgi:hypothetical protein